MLLTLNSNMHQCQWMGDGIFKLPQTGKCNLAKWDIVIWPKVNGDIF